MALRFICHHAGPRGRQYGIPVTLERIGMLSRFYTDFCISHRTASGLRALWPAGKRPQMVQNLLSRTLPSSLPRYKVRTLSWRQLQRARRGSASSVDEQIRRLIACDDTADANAIYSIFNSDLEMLTEAKRRGLLVVHDQVLTPDVGLILREERTAWSEVEAQDSDEEVFGGIERDRAQWEVADLVLVPSTFTRDAVLKLGGNPSKVKLVPYGIDPQWASSAPQPHPGRILFVGSVGLRKGNHYLAQAARILARRGVNCEVRVVGPSKPGVTERSAFQGPTYVGHIPRSRVREEFLSADIYACPSLAEGSSIACIEALACGLPVVATPNAGALLEDGHNGFIVPARDVTRLADRLQSLVEDRALRSRMSDAARRSAQQLTWKSYAVRLGNALGTLERVTTAGAECTTY